MGVSERGKRGKGTGCQTRPKRQQDALKGKGRKENAAALVELVLELDPVQTQRVQERREALRGAKGRGRVSHGKRHAATAGRDG